MVVSYGVSVGTLPGGKQGLIWTGKQRSPFIIPGFVACHRATEYAIILMSLNARDDVYSYHV